MKKRLLMLACSFLLSIALQAQQVVWERSYGWAGVDRIYSVTALENGYLAVGTSDWFGIQVGRLGSSGIILVRLNEQGDTLFTRRLCYGFPAVIGTKPDGGLRAAVSAFDTLSVGTPYTALRLYKLNAQGEVIRKWEYRNTNNGWIVRNICVLADGGVLVVGNMFPLQPGGYSEGFAFRADSNGNELWRRYFYPDVQTYVHHAELLNGTSNSFLISGSAGSKVWGLMLDSTGVTQGGDMFFWQSADSSNLNRAGLLQSPDGNLIAWGNNSSYHLPDYRWFIGKYDTQGNKLWGTAQPGGCTEPYVNSEGQIMVNYGSTTNVSYFNKYNPDSTLVGSVALASSSTANKILLAAAWGNDSAVFAGEIDITFEDFYFVKIAHVGNPYITAVPALVAEAAQPLSLYPNPATNYFKISSANPGVITLFNAAGQNVLQQSVQPSEHVAISGLPQGLYMYRFVTSKGVSSGKVVRE